MKIRLQRFMADCGIASRRECEEMILSGRVLVNGDVRTEMPVMIDPAKDVVTFDGQTIAERPDVPGEGGLQEQRKVYFLLNKPKGILVTNFDPSDRKTVGELMRGVPERVFPVGRLDMDSRGALIMTNDGELANRLTHPRFGVEKTYIVEVDGRMGPGDIEKIKAGMWLGPDRGAGHGIRTDRFRVKILGRERGRTIMEVKISEGKNREVRRVMARIGHPVRDLNRVAIGDKLTIKGLEVGAFRPLSESEVKYLFKISSPEYHEKQKSATQQWYEAKEMEKERKRLEKDVVPPSRIRTVREELSSRGSRTPGKSARAGKFGANTGGPRGGKISGNTRRFADKPQREESRREKKVSPNISMPPKGKGRASHPLGDAAGADE